MNTYKNNYRRRYKSSNDRNYRKRNGNGHKLNGEYNNNLEFKRKNPGRNNQNASKLIEKYNNLAREALSNGDKILSENYLQHADHFSRIHSIQELSKEATVNIKNGEQAKIDKNTETEDFKNSEKTNELNIPD